MIALVVGIPLKRISGAKASGGALFHGPGPFPSQPHNPVFQVDKVIQASLEHLRLKSPVPVTGVIE
ncbi:MAG TPA: hypothetical protein PK907_05635 [Candidatus Sabulitectum sp.]|nr:hypothetical protein [Candidatus Sabulitectum sp.]